MNRTHIIIGLLIVLVIVYLSQYKKKENLDSPNLSNEAIQNIASVYANTAGEAVFNKIRSTGGVTGNVTGDVVGNVTGNLKGDVTGNLKGDVTGNLKGDVTGDVTGNVKSDYINSRVIYGKYIIVSDWSWGSFGREALKYFKKSDPNGTYMSFLFRSANVTNTIKFLTYIKIDDYIILLQHLNYDNYMGLNSDNKFIITN